MRATIVSILKKFRQLQGSPASLARGTAVGVFIGFAPVMPFKSMLILMITVAARSSTVAALLVCTLICNPLTYLPLYYIAWLIGNLLLPGRVSWELLKAAVSHMREVSLAQAVVLAGHMGLDMGLVLLAGGLTLALPLAIASYLAAFRFFAWKARRQDSGAEA